MNIGDNGVHDILALFGFAFDIQVLQITDIVHVHVVGEWVTGASEAGLEVVSESVSTTCTCCTYFIYFMYMEGFMWFLTGWGKEGPRSHGYETN